MTSRALLVLAMLAPQAAPAQPHTGTISEIRIDAQAQPAMCVRTFPAMPEGALACVYSNRAHYREMRELLLWALSAKVACRFEWSLVDSVTNRARIDVLHCPVPR